MGSSKNSKSSGMKTAVSTKTEEKKMEEIAKVGGVSKISSGLEPKETGKEMMKAPRRDSYIFRDDFEREPSAYFRSLRD